MGLPFKKRRSSGSRFIPPHYANNAAWYDVSDVTSLRNNAGNIPSNGDGIKLIADKSGNSGTNCLCLNGVAGNYASAPDSAALSITGDIDIRAKIAVNSLNSGVSQYFLSKWLTTGVGPNSYVFGITATGALELAWSTTGANTISKTSTASTTAVVSNYTTFWARATLDVDDGAGNNVVTFYTSTDDGATWTQLGSAVTTAGTTSIFDSTTAINLGAFNGGANSPLTGRIYRAQIYNGIAGTLVFDANFSLASKLATSFTESSSNAATVTINTSGDLGARIAGERDLYQGTAANQPIYLPHTGTNYGYAPGPTAKFDTPDAAINQISDDIDIRVCVQPYSVPSGGDAILAHKGYGNGWWFIFTGASQPYFAFRNAANTATRVATSGYTVTAADIAQPMWWRVTRVAASGAILFYKSTDGTNWTTLYTGTLAAGESMQVAATPVTLNAGVVNLSRFYGAKLYNGVAGTLVADFDPSRYTSGTTFVASTGETWTLNGGAAIVTRTSLYFDGSNDYMKAPAFSLSQPETVYFVGSQVTNTSADYLFDGNTGGAGGMRQAGTLDIGLMGGSGVITPALNTQFIGTALFNTPSFFIRLNRGAAISTTAPGATSMNGFSLGANGTPGGYANITFREAAIYAAAHDTATQDKVVRYAGSRWRITV